MSGDQICPLPLPAPGQHQIYLAILLRCDTWMTPCTPTIPWGFQDSHPAGTRFWGQFWGLNIFSTKCQKQSKRPFDLWGEYSLGRNPSPKGCPSVVTVAASAENEELPERGPGSDPPFLSLTNAHRSSRRSALNRVQWETNAGGLLAGVSPGSDGRAGGGWLSPPCVPTSQPGCSF